MKAFLSGAAVAFAICWPAVSPAQEWVSDTEPPPMAWIENDDVAVEFVCTDSGRLIFKCVLELGVLHEAIDGLPEADLVFAVDEVDGVSSKHWVTLEPIVDEDGSVTFGFSGSAADWARMAMQANRTIHVSLSPNAGDDEFFLYNAETFTAVGSTAALRPVVEACG